MKAIIANAVEAASADMSWKAIDRYSKDYIELQQKDKVRFYKTPDAILQRQLEIYDSVVAAKVKENPLFKEIVESQVDVRPAGDAVGVWTPSCPRTMAINHYFGPKAKKPDLTQCDPAKHHSDEPPDGALSH